VVLIQIFYPFKIIKIKLAVVVMPAVAVLAGGTICHELPSNSKIELPPELGSSRQFPMNH
jgi:hypothetical protein